MPVFTFFTCFYVCILGIIACILVTSVFFIALPRPPPLFIIPQGALNRDDKIMMMVIIIFNDTLRACIYRYCCSSVNDTGDWPKKNVTGSVTSSSSVIAALYFA